MSSTSLILFYAISALIVVLLLFRWSRRRKRERQAVAERVAARLDTATHSESAETVSGPSPSSEEPITEQASQPVEPAPSMPRYETVDEETHSAQANGPAMPSLFDVLGKRQTAASLKLPRVEADETPLVESNDMVFGALTPVLSVMLPDSDERRAQAKRELQAAGYYKPHAHMNLAAVRYLCIMIPLILIGGLLLIVPPVLEKYVVVALILVPLLGWALPRLYVKGKAKERTGQIEHALPDMLDMLNMCVSQGMTLPAALARVNQELPQAHPALYKELQIVAEQSRIGTMGQALENFSRRIDTPEVHSFTSLIIQTERMGTSVSTALAEYSDNMRAVIKQRADEKGNRAAFKLLFPTVLCLMPAVYMFLLGPSVIEVTKFVERDDNTLGRANELIRQQGSRQMVRPGDRGR